MLTKTIEYMTVLYINLIKKATKHVKRYSQMFLQWKFDIPGAFEDFEIFLTIRDAYINFIVLPV